MVPPKLFTRLAALGLLVTCAQAQRGSMRDLSDPAVGLARAADANGDGELTGDEWVVFLGGLGADGEGVVDRVRVKLRLLGLDADGDGVMTSKDVAAVLEGRDLDGDGRAEGGFLLLLLPELADADGNGSVSADEQTAFLATVGATGDTPIPEAVLLDWLARSEAIPPADRNAMTAGVILVGMNTALDSDSSGRVTLDDLNALHRALDANGDGTIGALEREAGSPVAAGGGFSSANWAVTEAMRARPPLIAWQRNLDDALALSKQSGKPLLICVNMDGENASESLAWGRYRDPEFAKLTEGFVPLIVSPDRHNPRERDDRGRRIPDPRFGRLVDSEHIDIEPIVYERYFDGNRVAPRHVGVSPEGEVLFDVYLVQDLTIVDDKLREFGRPAAGRSFRDLTSDGPRTLEQAMLESPDATLRDQLEQRFVDADTRTRARFASLALSDVRATQHPELLRLALRDPDAAVRRQGLWTLLQHAELAPVDQLPVAFAEFGAEAELRAALIAAARRMNEAAATQRERDDAGFFLRVFESAFEPSGVVDVERWKLALALASPSSERPASMDELDRVGALVDALSARVEAEPEDVELSVQLAAGRARLAQVLLATGGDPRFAFDDVVVAAQRALELEPDEPRALGLHAWASYMNSDMESAGRLAARALPGLVRDAGAPLTAEVLNVFANARTSELYAAIGAGEPWAPELVPDALAAYEVLVSHPAAAEGHWRAYLDLLGAIQARGLQAQVVRRGLAQLPTSTVLHGYLRMQVLRDEGARALEQAYEEAPLAEARGAHAATLDWFHGLATFLAAEQDVQNQDSEAALAAYQHSIERFDASVTAEESFQGSAAHYQALAFAGRARVLLGEGRLAEAGAEMLASLERAPRSAGLADGLGNAPSDTARALRRALVRAGERERAGEIDAALRTALPGGVGSSG